MEHGFIGLLFIVVALIFIFGGRKRLEDLGAGFGGFMREFNKARQDAAAATDLSGQAKTKPAAKPKPKAKASTAKKAAPRRKR